MLKGKPVRIRWVKPYKDANNHVAIGDVIQETASYLTLMGKTFHFGRHVGGRKERLVSHQYTGGIVEGDTAVRHIPWARIEVISELPRGTVWDVPAEIGEDGLCVLCNKHRTVITRVQDAEHA